MPCGQHGPIQSTATRLASGSPAIMAARTGLGGVILMHGQAWPIGKFPWVPDYLCRVSSIAGGVSADWAEASGEASSLAAIRHTGRLPFALWIQLGDGRNSNSKSPLRSN